MGHQFIKHSLIPNPGVLASKGSHFCCSPPNPPNVDYIAAIESVCQKLKDQDTEKLSADINGLLRRVQAPKPNLIKALAELKRDKDRLILTGDKGVAMVVLDKENTQKRQKIY